MHLISPARSLQFGSERSHFAHSPHLLSALILLIPPEIGGELKRKTRSRGCGLGFCAPAVPGGRAAPGLQRALASERASVGNVRGDTKGDGAASTFLGGAGSLGGRRRAEPTVFGCRAPRPGCRLLWAPRGAGGGPPRPPHPDARAGGLGAWTPPRFGVAPRPTPAQAPRPALTRCNSPAHFSPCDLPSVNSSLT